jgi:hypothetical protein
MIRHVVFLGEVQPNDGLGPNSPFQSLGSLQGDAMIV